MQNFIYELSRENDTFSLLQQFSIVAMMAAAKNIYVPRYILQQQQHFVCVNLGIIYGMSLHIASSEWGERKIE